MNVKFYVVLLAMTIATYLIRVLPITLNQKYLYPFIFILCALCNVGCNDFSSDYHSNSDMDFRMSGAGDCNDSGLDWKKSFSGVCCQLSCRIFSRTNCLLSRSDVC